MKNRKGITLIELILTLALISLALTLPVNIFTFSKKAETMAMTQVEIQSASRLITEYVNNITRFATKTHTIPKSSFQHSENGVRDPITSYIGITKDGHVVIDKPGPTTGDPRIIQYVAKKQEGIDYEIIFKEVLDSNSKSLDKILNFSIIGKKDGKIVTEIASNIEIMNSLQIDYLGTDADPAVALAFSMVDPGSQEWINISPDAYITMVLDVSGSMAWDMDGKSNSTNDKRIDILKYNANKMIDRLANMDFDIYVSLVPFSYDADDPKEFHNVNEESGLSLVKGELNALKANGATNTGDGIRRAYHQLKSKSDQMLATGKQYSDFTQHMMILVDGATNRETREITGLKNHWWYGWRVSSDKYAQDNKNTNNSLKVGNNRIVSVSENDNAYITDLGNDLIKSHTYEFEGETKQVINAFVIGFSNVPNDHNSLEAIGQATNAKQFEHEEETKPYILATDADELDFAFGQFESEVENSLWVITRPKLNP